MPFPVVASPGLIHAFTLLFTGRPKPVCDHPVPQRPDRQFDVILRAKVVGAKTCDQEAHQRWLRNEARSQPESKRDRYPQRIVETD